MMDNGEYLCKAAPMRRFIELVLEQRASIWDPQQLVRSLQPAFTELLTDQSWLSPEFCAPNPEGGMGGGIASWLLYRSPAKDMTLMSLVVPSGSQTPVHDHLAWGLVGLYRGEQDEDIY